MLLLIHDSHQSTINSQLVEVADCNISRRPPSPSSERPRYRLSRIAAISRTQQSSTLGQAGCSNGSRKLTTRQALCVRKRSNRFRRPLAFECVAHSRGAYFSNFGSLGSIASHGCASDVQISCCGLYKLGSSKVPAATPCPKLVLPPNNREPHSGQNREQHRPSFRSLCRSISACPW